MSGSVRVVARGGSTRVRWRVLIGTTAELTLRQIREALTVALVGTLGAGWAFLHEHAAHGHALLALIGLWTLVAYATAGALSRRLARQLGQRFERRFAFNDLPGVGIEDPGAWARRVGVEHAELPGLWDRPANARRRRTISNTNDSREER